MIKTYSIRRQLLKWLLIPMLILLILDSSLLYHFASKLERQTFDRGLLSTANDIQEFLEKFNQENLVELDQTTKKALLSDDFDQVFYSVKDEFGQNLIGDAGIASKQNLQDQFSTAHTIFYYSEFNHQKIRVISMPATIQILNKAHHIYIQVAETLNKRKQIRKQILVWILLPQLILLAAAGVLLWVGIKRGLNPLWAVNDALTKRSYSDLEPIQLSNIPIEIAKLVDSVNGLMTKLNQAIHSQNRFIADAAHQLRTPLSGTRAQIELANKSTSLPDIKSRLQKISISTERLIHLINQLLVLAKIQPEALHQIDFEPIDLVSILKEVVCELDLNSSEKNIELTYVGGDKKVMISGERLALHNLMFNLIDNAIRYTPYAGEVTLNILMKENSACLVVEDNGFGIHEDERALIFERFYRGNQTAEFGTGLGLAIVKEIVALHKGSITIENGHQKGTKVSVYFPKLNLP